MPTETIAPSTGGAQVLSRIRAADGRSGAVCSAEKRADSHGHAQTTPTITTTTRARAPITRRPPASGRLGAASSPGPSSIRSPVRTAMTVATMPSTPSASPLTVATAAALPKSM